MRSERSIVLVGLLFTAAVQALCVIAATMLPFSLLTVRVWGSAPIHLASVVAVAATPVLVWLAVKLATGQARLSTLDSVLHASRDWMWAVDSSRTFTYCSQAVEELLGYEPAALVGRPITEVIDPEDLAETQQAYAARPDRQAPEGTAGPDVPFSGVHAACRHREGHRVWLELSGVTHHASDGTVTGYEGTSRALGAALGDALDGQKTRARIARMLDERLLLTAFQPIFALDTGQRLGAEALTRFIDDRGGSPEKWFRDAEQAGLGVELDLLAVTTALGRASELPDDGYVSLNVSPATCLDARLLAAVDSAALPATRIVLEITEHTAVCDYTPLCLALAALRSRGVRIAIDDAGAGFSSGRHIIQLRPDFIKIDRSIVTGLDTDPAKRALASSMVHMASELNAHIVAEGIETPAELAAVTALGIHAAQGYLLGRPTVSAQDWGPPTAEPILGQRQPRTTS